MITVMLYGFLGKKFGRVHRYDIKTPAEAVKALSVTLDGFKQSLIDGGYYKVLRGGKDSLDIKEINDPQSNLETIRIVPVVQGAGPVGRIILGAALIAASFIPGMQAFSPYLVKIGASMILGGVAELLFAAPKTQDKPMDKVENRPSYAFDGATNTAAQGNPVPLCYGELVVGSQVISAGLSVEQI